MKIYCDKCGEDISSQCNRAIENYNVGRIVCGKCHHEQKRYISEADLLLYFGISEVMYILLSLLSVFIFKRFGISIPTIIILFALFILSYFISKEVSSSIYQKAYFKNEIRNKNFEEDEKAIQRNMSWQFMLFFAITITYITMDEGKLFFGIAMPLAALFTFIKLFLQLKYEKRQ
ncbi:MAG: hypothetical protein IKS54_01085 [Erysipelotrichaceae bacterium]|nr:hypothetical protein [Erysipelotrichaceae bacterium]